MNEHVERSDQQQKSEAMELVEFAAESESLYDGTTGYNGVSWEEMDFFLKSKNMKWERFKDPLKGMQHVCKLLDSFRAAKIATKVEQAQKRRAIG